MATHAHTKQDSPARYAENIRRADRLLHGLHWLMQDIGKGSITSPAVAELYDARKAVEQYIERQADALDQSYRRALSELKRGIALEGEPPTVDDERALDHVSDPGTEFFPRPMGVPR